MAKQRSGVLRFSRELASVAVVAGLAAMLLPQAARAARISNKVAVFSGLDKITGRTTTFDVYVNETVQFGALQVTPRVCFTRDDAEAPKTDAFVAVDEITLDRKIKRIFTGWMFAASPGLNAIEHPVYDVWLKDCKMTSDVPPPPASATDKEAIAPSDEPPEKTSAETQAPAASPTPQTTPAAPPAPAAPQNPAPAAPAAPAPAPAANGVPVPHAPALPVPVQQGGKLPPPSPAPAQ